MKKEIVALLTIVLVVGIIIYGKKKEKEEKEIIKLPQNYELLKAHDSIEFKFDPSAKQIKDVVFIEDSEGVICEISRWIPYIKKYPKYPFLFYIRTKSKERVLKYLQAIKFPLPVFILPFRRTSMLLVSYRVNEKNELLKIINPSLSTFEQFLKANKDKYGGK